jgi:hypothetical protein
MPKHVAALNNKSVEQQDGVKFYINCDKTSFTWGRRGQGVITHSVPWFTNLQSAVSHTEHQVRNG